MVRLDSGLTGVVASTFLGESANDGIVGLAFGKDGSVSVAGTTLSPDFPGIGPASADRVFAGGEGFVARLTADLSRITASRYLGCGDWDGVCQFAPDEQGRVQAGSFDGSVARVNAARPALTTVLTPNGGEPIVAGVRYPVRSGLRFSSRFLPVVSPCSSMGCSSARKVVLLVTQTPFVPLSERGKEGVCGT